MKQPIVLIGGGEHARVVAEAVLSQPKCFELRGFVDPAPCAETVRRVGLPRLGDETALAHHADAYALIAFAAIGATEARMQAAARITGTVRGFACVVHAAAWVSESAVLEEGTIVMAGAVVQTGAQIGAHGIVNSGAVIEHDVQLGAFVHVAPSATIGGAARVGQGTFVGLGACVRDHVTIGSRAVIGMGAVVVVDVADDASVKGNPAR